jgi:hypothetical protein
MATAKTFKSNQPHFFTKPQGLSNFGIPIPGATNGFTLGLEEFNFCDILSNFTFEKKHIAYIPSYSCEIAQGNLGIYEILELFFHNGNNQGTTHYATMFNVSRIPDNRIQDIREQLILAGFPNYVNTSAPWPNYLPAIQLVALEIWNANFAANRIIAPNGSNRFVANMFYESIEIHNPMMIRNDWQNLNHACQFYNQ